MKVAYFDYWTRGIHNFLPIDPLLREQGHETILLHLASWNDPSPREETVQGIRCRDISYYGTRFIGRMLAAERPDAVLTLNTTKIMDRVVVMECRRLNIPSLFLMHGIRNLGDSNQLLETIVEKAYGGLWTKLAKLPKYLRVMIPNYFLSAYRSDTSAFLRLRALRVLYDYFRNPGRSFYSPIVPDELVHDYCLVYARQDVPYYMQRGYPRVRIAVTGNPRLDSLMAAIRADAFATDDLPGRVRALLQDGRGYALYLDEALPEQNSIGGYTASVRREMIRIIAERVAQDGLTLVVKLHPTTDASSIGPPPPNVLIEGGCLDELIRFSTFCLANISTTINNAILMNKPVISPRWGVCGNLPAFFVNEGVARPWNDPAEPLVLEIDDTKRQRYIDEYISVTEPEAACNVARRIVAAAGDNSSVEES